MQKKIIIFESDAALDTFVRGYIQGIPGIPGKKGSKGDTGASGATWYSGASDPEAIGLNNDLYLNTTTGDVFKKVDGDWTLLSNIKGADGDDGADGNTILSGTVDPTTEGVNGDFYIQITTQKLYKKESGTWVEKCNIKGAAGTNGRSYIWHGAWDSGHGYNVDDTVSYNGSSYVSIQAGTNKNPASETAYWNLLASKGDAGSGGSLDIGSLPSKTTLVDADVAVIGDSEASNATKKVTFANIVEYLRSFFSPRFRVGDILESTSSVNPGQTVANGGLGYGTWVAFGTGRMTVGIDTNSADFDTVEETHGNVTVDIHHTHPVTPGNMYLMGGPILTPVVPQNTGNGGSTSLNIMNPYIIVYRWKRQS